MLIELSAAAVRYAYQQSHSGLKANYVLLSSQQVLAAAARHTFGFSPTHKFLIRITTEVHHMVQVQFVL
jgi:hypothetical protein